MANLNRQPQRIIARPYVGITMDKIANGLSRRERLELFARNIDELDGIDRIRIRKAVSRAQVLMPDADLVDSYELVVACGLALEEHRRDHRG